MASAPTAAAIAADAHWLAQAIDPAAGMVRLVAMTRDDYRAAAFLDDRLLQRPVEQAVVPFDAVISGLGPDARSDARWIFHIGHVGSTLLSRLMGEMPGILAVREPRLLRDIALTPGAAERFATPVRRLLSRTFAPGEVALVKATSFASEIAAPLVGPEGRAIFLTASPRAYIATILAGPNSLLELDALAPLRTERLRGRVALPDVPTTKAHAAALAWACETTALEHAAAALGAGAVQWMDFDRLLADVPGGLRSAAAFVGVTPSDDEIDAIASGPLLRRYSKALEHDYSPQLRAELLAEAAAAHRADIDAALVLLAKAAQESPLLAKALTRAGPET